jgi:hypothetical protein
MELPCRIYVHASKAPVDLSIKEFEAIYDKIGHGVQWHLDYGAIIGEVTITACVQDSPSPWAEPGLYHFLLADPVLYDKPIPYCGQLGFFEVQL